jgi:predicted polyphosphate/ATP-dependent NAD kinase
MQSAKARSGAGERTAQEAIAHYLVDQVLGERLCLIGPGTTTKAVMAALGLEKTLLGVDVVRGRQLVAADADEQRLLELAGEDTLVVVTPVGGQGFVFGRGNQQLSARVIGRVGLGNVVVIATEAKITALGGRPLLVDTGDAALDAALAGYRRVITGYERQIVYRVAS